jgi:hypothetical protein
VTGGPWKIAPANKRVAGQWEKLRNTYPVPTRKAIHYWTKDPYAPNGLVVRPRGPAAVRLWGNGAAKKSYQQRIFLASPVSSTSFIVVDEIGTVIITAVISVVDSFV